jgi:hypothetical protein
MRSFRPLLTVTAVLALAGTLLAAPAAAGREARPEMRAVTRSVVHAGPVDSSQERPTSFDVFARGSRPTLDPGRADGVAANRPLTPSVTFGFDALADLDGFYPSDTVGALGETVYVTAVNSSIGIFSATDGSVVLPRRTLGSLSGEPGFLQFDPKVIHDPYANVFLVVWLGFDDAPQRSTIFALAIPDATAADTGTWCLTSLLGDQVAGDGAQWADYPGVGYDEDRVTITTNQFSFANAFRYAQVMSIDKTLYDCDQPTPVPIVFGGSQTRDRNGLQAFTLQPAQTVGTGGGAQLLLSFELVRGRFDYLTIWRIKPTASGLVLKKGTVSTGKVSLPPPGTQGGGGVSNGDLFWDAGDERLVNAFYDADRDELYAAHAVRVNLKPDSVTGSYPEAAVRWYEIDPANKLPNSVLVRKGLIGTAEADLGWPTVATDANGNLFVTYSRASAPLGEFLSAWVAEIPPGSTTATQLLMHPGLATYDASSGVERWGDYTGINRSPLAPQSMATFNQYAATTTTWQQVVHAVAHT